MADAPEKRKRLDLLLGFLERDRDNTSLLADAAAAALDAEKPAMALELLARLQQRTPLTPQLLNLEALAGMKTGAFEAAARAFRLLLQKWPDDSALRFNLAWSLAMSKQTEDALAALSETTLAELPQAAMLQVELLHERGDFEDALIAAKRHLRVHAEHPGLNAAASVLAIDMEDMALAEACALKAKGLPDGITTLATLALRRDETEQARVMFDEALATDPEAPRALVGKGLVALAVGDPHAAARYLEHGAERFGDHLGSWIAAGWANLLAGDQEKATAMFERTLGIDDTFAEAQGSMAVAALMKGDVETARRLTAIALRLDPNCFSGALAKALMLQTQGRNDAAQIVMSAALQTPIDASGATIAQLLAKRALSQG